jgi:GR25 family glycosyltransferase involved in LPS biosynthesis
MIPKIIHQIWIGTLPKPNYWINTWSEQYLEQNPEYEYKLWDNDNYLTELDKYPVLKMIFQQLKHYCYKVDILRLIILYEYGGIYIDADIVWINSKSLDSLIIESKNTNLFVGRTPGTNYNDENYYLTNSVISSTKGHVLIKKCICSLKGLIYNWHQKKYDSKLVNKKHLGTSKWLGPGLITRELKDEKITIFPPEYFYPITWHGVNVYKINYNKYPNSYMFQFGFTTNKIKPLTKHTFYWINLDRNLTRRNHMYQMFSSKICFNQRISAYDGDKIEKYPEINFKGFKNINKYEYGCCFSHLKAIKMCYDKNEPIGIICEDDLCLDYISKWSLSIDEIILQAPDDWEIIKIHCNYSKHIKKLLKRKNKIGNFSLWGMRSVSTLGYIINSKGMKKILDKFCIHNEFHLTDEIESKADILIYKNAKTYDYTSPLLNHLCDGSQINKNQDITHQEGAKTISNYFNKL